MRIGFANGCFDIFHDGHRHFLKKARQHCDYLIVAVNTDASVASLKGEGRPKWPLLCRMAHIRPYAQSVIPFNGDPLPLILAIAPQVLIRGADQSVFENEWGEGRDLLVIARLPGISTTELIKGVKHETD